MLNPVMGQDIYDVRQSIADEKETDESQKCVQTVGKA